MNDTINRRILIIDDNQAIHDDFRKILCNRANAGDDMAEAETSLFGIAATSDPAAARFEIDSAFQGTAGLACVEHALSAGQPYAMAFIDVRMPPGWDGIETTERIWKVDPDLQIVICTAYSDYSWNEVIEKVGQSDRLVILKKPFDNIEASQLALTLTNKWHLTKQARHKLNELGERVRERTIELTTINASLRTEVTERKQAEEALKDSRELYRNLIESQGEGVVIMDLDRRFTFANPAAETILGAWPGQLVGKKLDEFVDEENRAIVQAQFKPRRAGEKSSYEIAIIAARGERRQILITGTPQMDSEGCFCGTFAVFRDITQRKLAERALRESQRLLKAILDNIPDPAWLKDAQGRYLLGNRSLAQIYQRRMEEIAGKTAFEVFPECAAKLAGIDRSTAVPGKPVHSECMVPDADGHHRWFDAIETPVFNEQNEMTGTAGIARDITERKQMEATLRESEARYRSLFEGMLNGYAFCRMIYVDGQAQDFTYLAVNPAFETLTGLKDVVGKNVSDTIPGFRVTDSQLLETFSRVALTGKPEQLEVYVKSLAMWFSVSVYSPQKEHFVAVFDVITERKQAEHKLRASEERFRGLLESSQDAIMLLEPPAWKFTFGNPATIRMFGAKDEAEFTSHDPWDLSPDQQPDGRVSADKAREMIEAAVRKGSHFFEWTHRRIGGDEFQADVLLAKMEREGKVVLQATVRDITERKQMEENLRQKTTLFEAMVNSSPDGILIVNEQGKKILQNPQFARLTKIPAPIAEQLDDAEQLQYVTDSTKDPEQFLAKVLHLNAHPDETSRDEIEFKDGRILDRYSAPVLDEKKTCYGRIWMFRDITERKRTEEKLRLQTSALAAAANGIAITDRTGLILWVNPAFTRLTGYDSSEVVGRTPALLKSGVHDKTFYQDLWATILSGKVWQGELVNRRKDGSQYHEEMTITPVRDEKGEILNFVAVKQDISPRKQAEEALKEQLALRERLAKIAANVPGIIYAFRLRPDGSACVPYASPTIEEFYGVRAEDLVEDASPIFNLIHPDDQVRHQESIAESARTMTPWRCEFRVRHPKKGLFWAEGQSTPERQADGSILWHGFMSDITKRREAEGKFQLNEKRYRTLVEATAAIVWDGPPSGEFAAEQPSWTAFTGQSFKELRGRGWLNAIHPDDHAETTRVWSAAIANRSMCKVEYRLRARDQSYHHMLVRVVPILADDGTIQQWVGVANDITKRKQAEAALRDSEAFLNTVVENIPHMIFVKDAKELRFVKFNKAGQGLLGYSLAELAGKNDYDFFPKELADRFTENDRKVLRGAEIVDISEEPVQTRNKGERILHTKKIPIFDNTGQLTYLLGISEDITERKQGEKSQQMMELQLRQAQKMEAIGQLAAGIAHEINTPTQYVGDNTRFLKDAFDNVISLLRSHGELLAAAKQNTLTPELLEHVEETLMASDVEYLLEQVPKAIQETLEGVERVTQIVRAMKEFSHPGGREKSVADLNKAIESTATVARNEWKYVSDLKLDLDPDLPLVPCYIGEFNQVILNLVVNAAHAIGDVVKSQPGTKGIITVQTRREGDSVAVRVSDTGTGIPEANRRRIFEPFFTTKAVGKGSGQGLALVYTEIVKKHGGTVTFETEVGKGTTFVLHLPINLKHPAGEEPLADEPAKRTSDP